MPQIDAKPRVEEKKECAALRAEGRTPAVVFSRKLPPGREHQTMLSVHTQRIHDITLREGFTGRAYWLNVEGQSQRVLVRPHQVQLAGDSTRPTNLTFCIIDENELNEDVARTASLLPLALAALGTGTGPKPKRD